MKTLLVDDDPFALDLLALQLENLGCVDIHPFERARDALDLLEQDVAAIGLVFCDLQMPEIDGVEFVRHLARIGFQGDLVMISAESGRILQAVRKLAGAHHIQIVAALPKPVTPEQLQRVLADCASLRQSAQRPLPEPVGPDALADAIANGQLVNRYQPKVRLSDGMLIGVEALVRWQRPSVGLVYPDQFVGVAEQYAMIDALTHRVLSTALRDARQWLDAGLPLQVSVNVSMDNLSDLAFADTVERLTREAGIATNSLMLEVTESRLMEDVRAPLDILSRLSLKRVGLSIDDFGTGHSSLAQLRDIPFNELKLDRSFVTGAQRDPALQAIIRAALAMAQQLDMKSVAEGVETLDDWTCLRALGCDVAQGYLISRPMPADALAEWGRNWDRRRLTLPGPAP